MFEIDEQMAAKFHLPPVRKYPHPTRDWYNTFLIQTDYTVSKAAEAQLLGESVDDYTDVLRARKIARSAINAIDDGTYDGEEAMQDIDIEEGIPVEEDGIPEEVKGFMAQYAGKEE